MTFEHLSDEEVQKKINAYMEQGMSKDDAFTEVYSEDCNLDNKEDYVIPVSWEVYSTITVRAESREEALEFAEKHMDQIPLCVENEYIDSTYLIDDVRFLNGEDIRTVGEIYLDADEDFK